MGSCGRLEGRRDAVDGEETMLLWEHLSAFLRPAEAESADANAVCLRSVRLPYDKRCSAITKAGTRCHGRIKPGSEFCFFHDPALTRERRRLMAAKGTRKRRLAHLPDGYLRKLSNRAAVATAMDRLYREIRLGRVTLEMGEVLFKILTRLLDSGLVDAGLFPQRTKAGRIRPKLMELLTSEERSAWRRATANAEALPLPDKRRRGVARSDRPLVLQPEKEKPAAESPKVALQAAS